MRQNLYDWPEAIKCLSCSRNVLGLTAKRFHFSFCIYWRNLNSENKNIWATKALRQQRKLLGHEALLCRTNVWFKFINLAGTDQITKALIDSYEEFS